MSPTPGDGAAPRRILVVGSGGAGKSTFASRLGARTGLPVIHLDAIYWRPGWREPTREEFRAQLGPVLADPQWIMDGNYGATVKQRARAADLVILLERSRWLCLWRVVARRVRFHGQTRPTMGEDCPEHLTVEFLKYVYDYRRVSLPKMYRRLDEADCRLFVALRSRREIERFVRDFPTSW